MTGCNAPERTPVIGSEPLPVDFKKMALQCFEAAAKGDFPSVHQQVGKISEANFWMLMHIAWLLEKGHQ